MDEIRVLAPTACIGDGFHEGTFYEAIEKWQPHVIGCDSGIRGDGPYWLGTATSHWDRRPVKRDLATMLVAARRYDIPLLIGSAGSVGADPNLEWLAGILREVASEHDLHFKLALIRAEQSHDYLKQKLVEGKIRPLHPAPELDDQVIDRSAHIVGMMGHEPYLAALEGGAQVVLAGRSIDSAIFAGVPLREGFPPGLVWHAATVVECGGVAADKMDGVAHEGMVALIRHDSFELTPTNPQLTVSPLSVVAQTLYEERSAFDLVVPSGTLKIADTKYEAVDDRLVRVSGSRFEAADQYEVKLEGVEPIGYQACFIGGIRDPMIIRQFDPWLEEVDRSARKRVERMFGGSPPKFLSHFRVYGRNGVMGDLEPTEGIAGHELGIVQEVVAPTQEEASSICHAFAATLIHTPVAAWSGAVMTLAKPPAPGILEKGPVYRFNMNHVVVPDDPLEMFPIEYEDV
ncbi:MAG: hypothetical protein QOD72_2711 [Acidimicrobiaceae bacterium]|nr:hypothetical protein [Acidimicrobiaceae bacterium]